MKTKLFNYLLDKMKNKQYVINQFSPSFKAANNIIMVEREAPSEQQVLIKNMYVGINALYDRELYRGAVPYIDVTFPYVFGVEAVGEIVAVGDKVKAFKVGDQVGTVKVGTAYQEYQCIDAEHVIAFPEATKEYLTISPTGVSAHLALTEVAELVGNETVVVSAAAGGLGHILVQLCCMKGCKVVAICGSQQKVEMLESLDCCERIINYRQECVDGILSTDYKDKINIAIDSVGRNIFDSFLKNLAPKGKLVVIGLASELSNESFEKTHSPRMYEKMYWKGTSVRCFMNHLYKEKHHDSRQYLFNLFQKGSLKIKVDETKFSGIESIAAASKYLLAGKSCGKVVVEL